MKLKGIVIAAALALTGVGSMSVAAAPTASADISKAPSASERTPTKAAYAIGYDIRIHTADVNYAGTDGDVWMRVNGTGGSTNYWYLDDSADNFERNRTDRFVKSGEYVGSINSVTIYFDPLGGSDAEWLPDWITVNGVVFPKYRNTKWFQKGVTEYRTLSRW